MNSELLGEGAVFIWPVHLLISRQPYELPNSFTTVVASGQKKPLPNAYQTAAKSVSVSDANIYWQSNGIGRVQLSVASEIAAIWHLSYYVWETKMTDKAYICRVGSENRLLRHIHGGKKCS